MESEAVIFVKDGNVVKEMFFTEFEAVLDDVVGIADFASEELSAVFIQINGQLKISGAVFFLIKFDAQGRVAGSWNIPFRHLMDHASLGPDLGAGPIRVTCKSACPVAWYRRELWDPDMGEQGTFDKLTAAIERNRLGIFSDSAEKGEAASAAVADFFKDDAAVSTKPAVSSNVVEESDSGVAPLFNRKYRAKIRAARTERNLLLATQQEEFREQREALENDYSKSLGVKELTAKRLHAEIDLLAEKNASLEKQVLEHRRMLQEKTLELKSIVEADGVEDNEKLGLLQGQYERDLEHALKGQSAEFEALLSKREQELYDRATEVVELRRQLGDAQAEAQSQMVKTEDQVLSDMVGAGVVFVAYHPGIEHLVITKEEMPSYIAEPMAFAAEQCGVSLQRYRDWLTHYRLPICRACDDEGHICGEPVKKIVRPQLFRAEHSDRCPAHRE